MPWSGRKAGGADPEGGSRPLTLATGAAGRTIPAGNPGRTPDGRHPRGRVMADADDPLGGRPAYLPNTFLPRGGYDFLRAIARCVPKVLDHLYETVYRPHASTLPAKFDYTL